MPALIKHVRGTRAEWLKDDPIIPDGVIALSKENGGYNIVVGDGKTHFSDIRGTRSKIVDGYDESIASIAISDNDDIRLGEVEELYITLPENPAKNFTAMLTFFCGELGTMFSYPSSTRIFFTGADTENREFIPTEFNRYTLFFWYDGILQCNVRSVYYDYND